MMATGPASSQSIIRVTYTSDGMHTAHVNDAHDEHIHPAAEKAGQAAQKDADDLGHNGAAQTDNQGDPCPHPDPGPQIPASGIGAEPVLGTGRLVGVEQIGGLIAVRRKYGGKNGHQDDDDKEGQTDYGDFVGPNTAQHVPPVATLGRTMASAMLRSAGRRTKSCSVREEAGLFIECTSFRNPDPRVHKAVNQIDHKVGADHKHTEEYR